MRCLIPWSIALIIPFASCAKLGIGLGKTEAPKMNSPFGSSGVPPQLRGKAQRAGNPITASANATSHQGVEFTPEEDIVFTDPDNPESSLPELSTILTEPNKKKGPWEESETIAKQRAAREGKPLLIWFTDSARSPMCKALTQELFSTPDFEQWASEKLIRLKVDANIQVDEPDLSLGETESRRVEVKNYVAAMKKRYKILGHPSLLLLNPSGEVVGRYRGFKRGDADYFWGLIKHGEAVSAVAYASWRTGLEKKGYREWSDRKNRKVFAKLTGYSKGRITLIEPDGTRSQTHENKLSNEDQDWIDQQKKLRGLQ